MNRPKYLTVSVLLTFVPLSLLAGEPVFIPHKIDGPAHAPSANSWWFGPFNESCSVFDVNGDGRNDVIAGNGHAYGLYWLEQTAAGQGKPRFIEHAIEEGFSQFHAMTLADLNEDGHPDLVTGKRLLPHNGSDQGAFDPLFMFWYDMRGGQFRRHVLSFNHLPWFPGEDNRNPQPQFAVGTGMKVVARDVDQDRRIDILVAGKSGLYLFLHKGFSPSADLKHKLPPRRVDRGTVKKAN